MKETSEKKNGEPLSYNTRQWVSMDFHGSPPWAPMASHPLTPPRVYDGRMLYHFLAIFFSNDGASLTQNRRKRNHFVCMILVVYLGHWDFPSGVYYSSFIFSPNHFSGEVLSSQNSGTSEKKWCTLYHRSTRRWAFRGIPWVFRVGRLCVAPRAPIANPWVARGSSWALVNFHCSPNGSCRLP